jgi:autotransporter-associated beta strand protein
LIGVAQKWLQPIHFAAPRTGFSHDHPPKKPMKLLSLLALALGASLAQAQTINAVYFGQTHVLKATDAYFGLVGNREALIKVHVTAPGAPASPAVTATLNLAGQAPSVLTLTGPATLPASIPDGLGVVQHSYANTFTGIIPAAWVKKGLQITVNAGSATTNLTNLDIGAPTKVIMTMFDVQYFSNTTSDYPAGTFAEVEAKWPVADLEVRRLKNIVFPELVIPPRADVGSKAVRIRSKAEYFTQTNLSFDGEQAAALQWNGALKRAAGRSGRWSLYYLNVYNAFAGGQAGGFAGVGSGTSQGILHHELGHALSLPHWGDNAAYPYKGDMHGIQAPTNYNETHAGPAWAFHLPTRAFIPPTVQSGTGAGAYKVDPMQGGGTGDQESPYLLNHFSDYSVNQMRDYLHGHVVVWNPTLNSWAQWNQTAGDYTTTVTNNGVQFPTTRDTQVISIMASLSGANPAVNMVYPPIGPYTAGLIQLFDPTVAADRTAAQSKFAPTNGCDYSVRVVQGGVTKTYMLAASNLSTADPFAESSLITEAINLPASGGSVTKIELLSTPNAEDVGLPANPTVLYTWAPLMPEPSAFELPPTANSSSAITMTALPGEVAFGQTGGTIEYQFTETTGNPGATSSAWQTSRSYTDTGLTAGTQYSYTVSIRAGALATAASAPASATTPSAGLAGTITVNATEAFALASGSGYKAVTGLGTFDAATADKLVVVIAAENANNDHFALTGVRYNGKQMIEAVQQSGITADGAVAVYYLDNPGPVGSGIVVSGYNPNGGLGTAYALSGTRPGSGAFNSRKGASITSVPLTTSAANSLVIAALANSGNTNSAGTPTAVAPLTQNHSANWGSGWGSHAAGSMQVAAPGNVTPTFATSTGGSYSINIAAVEFLAETTPGSTWVQTTGGAQSWITGANWILGTAPTPLAIDTVDFSTVNLAANTTLTLGADRTGGLWKFGDTTGAETWTINSGNSITLGGTTPTIEVVNNSAQLNCVVAGSAGLTKTGAGTLHLNASNTYGGVTRINAGTLQATTLANGGSASSIGSASTAATNLILNGGTLEYSGAAVSTNRLFSLQASSTIDASGTGAVNFTNASAIGFNSSTTAKTLTLDGTNTGSNNITAIIGDNTGATSLTKSGTGTWMLSGANTFTGATIINGGTLRLANLAAVQNSSGLNINNGTNAGTLQLATNTAFATFPLLGGGSSAQGTILSDRASAGAGLTHVLGVANFGTNTYNFAAGTNVTSGTAGISFTSVNLSGGGNGTTVFNPTTANLSIVGAVTIPSGGTTKTLNLGGTSTGSSISGAIDDGIGTLSLTKSSTSTWVLSGLSATAASNYGGGTTIDGGTLRITTTSPSLAGGLTFGSAVGGTNVGTLDLSAASATFAGAFVARTNSANAITLGSGRTLQLNGAFTVGYNATAIPNTTTELDVTGAGTLSIGTSSTPTNANFQIGNGATSNVGNAGILDLNGLANFYANLGTGLFRVGSPTNSGSANGGGSTVILATNSTIQAATMLLGGPDGSANGGATAVQSLKLGSGTNVINLDTLNLGGLGTADGRSNGSITFNGATGTLKMRSQTDPINGRATLNMGVRVMDTGVPAFAHLFDTTAHSADLLFGTMTIGSRSTTGTFTGGVTAEFRFDSGTLNANDLIVGSRGGTTAAASTGTGIVSLGGGSATFNNTTGPIRLGVNTVAGGNGTGTLNISGGTVSVLANAGTSIRIADATVAGGTATGMLNLTGGTLTVAGDILRGAATGTSNATARLSGGTLNMGGHDIGAAGTGAVTFIAESGTLQNVASINGTGGLTKTTTGTLTLSGTNTYSGVTTVSAGVISIGSASAFGTTAGNTVIAPGAAVFAGSAVANTTIAEPFQIAGTGVTGAIQVGNSITGVSFSGAVTLGADATIHADGSTSSSFTGGISTNGFALTFSGSGAVNVATNGISGSGSVIKNTGGLTTLSAVNTFTGNTTVNAGSLVLADNAQLKFVLGSSSGSNNSISGAGTVTLNGDFVIDTSAADALTSGTWTLENVASLTGAYGSTFSVVGFTDAGSNKWTKANGTSLYTFDETTGTLTLATTASYPSWINGFFPAETNPLIIGATADPDHDGIENGVEMVIGGNPKLGMDTALLPTLELVTDPVGSPAIPAGNYLLFTYRRSDFSVAAGLTAACETDADLAGTWTSATGAPGVVIQVDDNFTFTPTAPNTDRVRVYVPRASNTTGFGRLKVAVP